MIVNALPGFMAPIATTQVPPVHPQFVPAILMVIVSPWQRCLEMWEMLLIQIFSKTFSTTSQVRLVWDITRFPTHQISI